ncbi:hypothetical protein ABT381_03945 [Streptomyces sp. NPDC000151]|uniref:hypothetical protein n=1 Tax=Streptomyces sp. NPDC000151 TaxID=3154244 RepID=UPI003318CCB6
MAAVSEKDEEAAVRERETAEQVGRDGPASEFAEEPERLAAIWSAQHAEWQRVRALMSSLNWDEYEPEQDAQGSSWARERQERREGALAARAAFEARRREEADELRAELWLSAAPSRLIRAAADRAGLRPAQVLAQLAERVVVGEDGKVSVPPFMPSR